MSKLENLEDSITTLPIAGCWLRIGKNFLYPAGRG